MRRGEIWTVSAGGAYVGKPRPAVVVQDDRFEATDSVTICVFTTDPTDAPLLRLAVEPDEMNGLNALSRLMVDKITTVPRGKLRSKVGRLGDGDLMRVNRALLVFLGIAAPLK